MKFKKPGPNKKKGKTKEEERHLEWIASLGCMICGGPANVHHIRESGEPRDHFKAIPLCHRHHQGSDGIHTKGKKEWRKRFGHELDMLEIILKEKANEN